MATNDPKKSKVRTLSADEVGLVHNPNQHIPQIITQELDMESLSKLRYEILSDKMVTLDHAKASEYIDLPVFKGEREVADAHVQFLYDEMRKHTFNPLLVILSTAAFGDAVYKINGQHTCWAVQFMPPKYSIQVREIKYRVQTLEEMKMLYASYDRLKARTDTHVSKVFLADTPAAEGLYSKIITRTVSGFTHWHIEKDSDRRRVSPEQIVSVIGREYSDLFRTVGRFMQDHLSSDLVGRQPVTAAMFATFEKVPTKAPEFWVPVIEGVGIPDKTDPRWHLRDILQKVSTRAGAAGKKGKRLLGTEDIYRVCINSWNKWRKGETVQAALRPTNSRVKPI